MAKKIAFRKEIDYFRHEFEDYYGNYRKNHRSAARERRRIKDRQRVENAGIRIGDT